MKFNSEQRRPKVLIVDDMHPAILDALEDFEVVYDPLISPDEIGKALADVEVLIIRSKINVTKTILDRAPNLKIIGRAGSGMDNIDLEEANKRNIACVNCGEANATAVGEQALGMLLSLTSNIVKGDREIGEFIWDREGNRGTELNDLTLGIIGFGNTGSALGTMMSGFRTTVLAYDKYKSNYTSGYPHVKECQLEELFESCDAISLHIPLNEETKNWIDTVFINRFKKPLFLLNLSRGSIVKSEDVLKNLTSGKLIGVGLDVLPNEKLDSYSSEERKLLRELVNHPRVVLTPHIGGWTVQSYKKISELLAEKARSRWKDLTARKILQGYD